ncbi:MAG: triple tyrosine motif-containing protein, partial [Bacteroidota bacterium]
QLHYLSMDLSAPAFNQYRHKLLPTSDEWIETGVSSTLRFLNLSPGRYELFLDATNSWGDWSGDPIRLTIIIAPPWWKSPIALLVYGLLLLAAGSLLVRQRSQRRIRAVRQQSKVAQAVLLEREQLRKENAPHFHDELGGKVTKISLFLTLAERSAAQGETPLLYLGKMRGHLKDLSSSFRDLLWVIDADKDSLTDTILRLKEFGEDLYEGSSATFSTQGEYLTPKPIRLDPQTKKQILLIFKEAMNNAAKYAEAQRIVLSVASSAAGLAISLRDNGRGFQLDKKVKGRGMKNMQARAQKIGAEISITSTSQGTVVRLARIPHLRED